MDTTTDVCIGVGPIDSIKKASLFQTFRAFLDNFKFPPFSPTMSLPQLQLLSMLIFSNSEPESVKNCNFNVNDVDFEESGDVSNIKYEGETAPTSRKDVKDRNNVKELLDFLESIGIIIKAITRNFNLGKLSSPVIIPGIKADKGLKFDNTFFVFELENSENNKIITTMKLGTTEGTYTNCNFVVIKVDNRSKTEMYRWDCKINNMTFYHGCKGAVPIPISVSARVGGSSKRRYSKSTNKTKRNKRARRTQRRNIKKNKSRRKYGKARNTKRILRRFRQ
jgi:hypothetical protein